MIAVAVLLSGMLYAQQSIKSDNVSDFKGVNMSGRLIAEMIPAEKNSISVELINSDITKFKWGVTDGILSMSLRPSQGGEAHAIVKIYYVALTDISISGSEVSFNEPLCSDMLTMKLSGSATVTAKLECKDLELEVVGNSALTCSGTAKYIDIRATEKSRIEATKLDAVSVNVDCATGAEVYVTALERLVAYAKTSASVFYRGEPSILKIKSSKVAGMGASVLNIGK